MNKLFLGAALSALAFFGLSVSLVSAASINHSNDPSHAAQFEHYCPPYDFSGTVFQANEIYSPNSRACYYSVPADVRALGHQVVLSLYKGTPGNATLIHQEFVFDGSFFPTLVQVQDFANFNSYAEGDLFFGVVYSAGPFNGTTYPDLEQFNEAFTTGSTVVPSTVHYVLPWELGPIDVLGPQVTVNDPAQGSTHAQDENLVLDATIADANPLLEVLYFFNNTQIDPLLPLPLSGAPLGTATLKIVATDIFFNETTSNTTFTVSSPVPDACPNVPGHQAAGPCADQVCADQGGTWDGDSCELPPDACPNVPGNQTAGPCADQVCADQGGTWDGDSCEFPATYTIEFLQPINNTGHQIGPNTSVFKAGSTVPVKMVVKDANGNSVQVSGVIAWIAPVQGPALSAPVTEPVYTTQPTSGNAFAWNGDHYQYNWKTAKGASGYWYYLYVVLPDNSVHYTIVGLR